MKTMTFKNVRTVIVALLAILGVPILICVSHFCGEGKQPTPERERPDVLVFTLPDGKNILMPLGTHYTKVNSGSESVTYENSEAGMGGYSISIVVSPGRGSELYDGFRQFRDIFASYIEGRAYRELNYSIKVPGVSGEGHLLIYQFQESDGIPFIGSLFFVSDGQPVTIVLMAVDEDGDLVRYRNEAREIASGLKVVEVPEPTAVVY